ncbi:hypothetical protein EC396_04965 [Lutibacter sp. HS1-25]|uniref:TlpA family protein disulfide reductase n=1 Tax=Lutibacter sp. HS1-25 TaxID=2485000 RepID=UPI00101123F3|nr:thioredoxin-like domain-containing protein [Lutibacter sp. HS1-25]RXP59402.1 hypothetical protein EC396_04965 [Lutibacter sp. HS1-25]
MLKKLQILVLLVTITAQSQQTVTGTINPINTDYTWAALYQLKGAKQIYVDNVNFENEKFSIVFPENSPSGMYRLRFKMDNQSTIDIIYNQKNIELKLDPSKPFETVDFITSEENIIYHKYVQKTNAIKQNLDAIQYTYFKMKTEAEKAEARISYQNVLLYYKEIQQEFEVNSEGMLASHFIKSNEKYYAEKLFENPQEYLNSEKTHFFEYINFTDPVIINSNVITQAVLDYTFYLNASDDVEVQQKLYKNAIDTVLAKVSDNNLLKSEIVNTLLYAFSQSENLTITDYLQENYYENLPAEYKNDEDINNILENLKIAIGRTAPDFTFNINGETNSLHNLNTAKTYVLVFWSTECSHCIDEVPKLYDYMLNKTNVQVIDIGLENSNVEFEKYAEKFEKWISVLGLGKWENSISKNYNIVSTPTYFILNEAKTIIEKPEYIEDVKAYFEN